MTVGQRIAQKRKEQQLSQEALGEALGVSRQSIYKWERDQSLPEIDKLIAMSRLFGVTVGWLLGVEEEHHTEDASRTESSNGELTEEQLRMVQEIVDRYLAAQSTPPTRKKWQRFCLAAAVLLLLLALWQLFDGVEQIRYDYNNLQNSVQQMDSSVSSQISTITDRVETILQAQNSLVADYDISTSAIDALHNQATFTISVTPKTYLPGMQVQLLAESGGQTVTAETQAGENQSFTGEITCQLTDTITLKANLLTGEKQEQQLLETINGLYERTLPDMPEVYAEQLYGIQLQEDGSVKLTQNAYFPVKGGDSSTTEAVSEDGIGPAEIVELRVGLFCNRTLVAWAEPCEQPTSYQGFEEYDFYTVPPMDLPGGVGDFYVGAVLATDEYGREFLCSGDAWSLLPDGQLEQWIWLDRDDEFNELYEENWLTAGPTEGWTLE